VAVAPTGHRSSRLADSLLTSFSGFVSLTSRELWAEPLPRPEEGEFPIADRRYWCDLGEPEKLGVELDSTWFACRTVRVNFLLSSELFPVELGGQGSFLGKRPSRNSRRKKDPDLTAKSGSR